MKLSRIGASARLTVVIALAALPVSLSGCAGAIQSTAPAGAIVAVGAENQYANVIEQIGGRYVKATAIESNPNTDPHSFEASPSVAEAVSAAQLVVQNGVGYDTYMEQDRVGVGRVSDPRKVIDVQKLLGLPDSTPNPHLWYKPGDDAGGREGDRRLACRRCSRRMPPTSKRTRRAFDASL